MVIKISAVLTRSYMLSRPSLHPFHASERRVSVDCCPLIETMLDGHDKTGANIVTELQVSAMAWLFAQMQHHWQQHHS